MLDAAGAEVMTQAYSDVRINGELDDAQFEFTPPAGAQVMDMTEQALLMLKPGTAEANAPPAPAP
jgi:hypothetical protein